MKAQLKRNINNINQLEIPIVDTNGIPAKVQKLKN